MAIASSLPSNPVTPTEQSLMTEIVDYVNKQSNGQLAERIRSSMTSLIGALDKQTSDMLSIKGHPLKWLLEDKKTVDAVKHFNKVLQTSVKLYSTNLQNLNIKLTTWTKDTSNALDLISTGFAGMVQATGQFVTALHSGRDRVLQLIDNITTEFDPAQVKQTNTAVSGNMPESELKAIATNILGAIISNGMIIDKKLGELHQDNRFLQHIATNQDSGVIPALDAIQQAITQSTKSSANGSARIVSQLMSSDDRLADWMEMVHDQSVEAQQDAEFNSQNLVVTVAGFTQGAVDQLKNLPMVVQQTSKDKKGVTQSPDSAGGGGILSLLGLGAAGTGAAASGMLAPLMALLKPVLKRLPIIGTLINFGLGIQRLVKGDVIGGVTQMAAGIAYMFPGIGTVIGLGLDALLYARDKQGGGAENLTKGGNDIFKQAWVVIKGKMQEWWDAISTNVSQFLTVTLPQWLKWGGEQLSKAWAWISDPNTLATFSQYVEGAVSSITDFISGPKGLTSKISAFFEQLPEMFTTMGEKLAEFFTSDNTTEIIGKVGEYAATILVGLGDIAVSVFELVSTTIGGLITAGSEIIGKLLSDAGELASQLYTDYAAPIIDPLVQNITQFPKRVWEWFKSTGPGKFLFGLFEGIGKIASGNTEAGIMALDASVMPGIGAVYKSLQKDTTGTIAAMLDHGTGTKMFSKTINVAKSAKQSAGNAIDWIKNTLSGGTIAASPTVVKDAIITNGKVIIPHKDDQIWAAKAGGPIDKAVSKSSNTDNKRDQQQLQTQLIKQLQKALQETLAQAISGQGQMLSQIVSSMPVASAAGGGSSGDSSLYNGDRDPAYIHRMKAWGSISPPARVAY